MYRTFIFIVFTIVMFISYAVAQQLNDTSKTYPQFKFAFTYGISNDNLQKENIDSHTEINDVDNKGVAQNSNQYQQFSEVVKPFEELTVTFTARPLNDNKLLLIRVGRMQNDYKYTYVTDEVSSSSTVIGALRTEITERFTVYPISFGLGMATHNHFAQLQAEFMYAQGYMNEDFTVVPSNGVRVNSSSSYHSETLGYRLSAQLNFRFFRTAAVHLEGGYRLLRFIGFTNSLTNEKIGLDYSASGPFFSAGLAVGI